MSLGVGLDVELSVSQRRHIQWSEGGSRLSTEHVSAAVSQLIPSSR